METQLRNYLSEIGRRGGKISRRKLDPSTAHAMVMVREARRAFRKYYSRCFWSFDPNLKIGAGDVPWVAEQLMKHAGRAAWDDAAKLCR